jgi:predicted permease
MRLTQDLRFAIRVILKDRWFTAVAALALGLGIGVNTTVFTFVNAVLMRGLPFDRSHEIYYVGSRQLPDGDPNPASYADFLDWKAQSTAFADMGAFRNATMNVSEAGRPPERVSGLFVTANTFRILRQSPFLGRDFTPDEDRKESAPVVIIGYDLWRTRYGSDRAILGRTIKVNDVACTIIGVMPEGMRFALTNDMWRPLVPDANLERRDQRGINVLARVKPDVSRARAEEDITAIAKRLQQEYPATNKNVDAELMTFNERYNGGPIRFIFLALLGAVGFVLLIACANVANLLLSRSVHRAREIAVRFALGASRPQVIRQLLIESTLLACLGGLLGLGLTYFGVRAFEAAVSDVGKPFWIVFRLDPTVFAYFALISIATGILFGLAPALQVSKTNVNELLKEGGRGTAGGRRARRLTSAMVIAELTLTLVLLAGAGLMMRSFLKLYSLDIGIDTTNLLTMRTQLSQQRYETPEQRRVFADAVLTRLGALPGVQHAALTSYAPMMGGDWRGFAIEGRTPPADVEAPRGSVVVVTPGYFDTLGVSAQRGRLFRDTDGSAGNEVVVVNERFAARYFPGENAVGQRIRLTPFRESSAEPWLTIVGVTPVVRQSNPQDLQPSAVIYQPFRQQPLQGMNILLRTAGPQASIVGSVRDVVQAVDPEQPVFSIMTMDEVLAQSRWPYRVFGTMFALFALIALVLSTVGIYAVTSYAVSQRVQEIGVRMALGAQPRQVSWLILRSGLTQLAIALMLGLPGAWGVGQALASVVAQIPPTDPVTFVGIIALLTTVTIAACLIPSWRATRLDPLTALRVE